MKQEYERRMDQSARGPTVGSGEIIRMPGAAPAGSATVRLQQVLIEWRAAEREHARALLFSAHPIHIRELADAMERALHHVRLNVDSEPWAEIARDELPNAPGERPADKPTI